MKQESEKTAKGKDKTCAFCKQTYTEEAFYEHLDKCMETQLKILEKEIADRETESEQRRLKILEKKNELKLKLAEESVDNDLQEE